MSDEISFDDFLKVDIRVGTVIDAQEFPEARRPALKLWVDFGAEIGTRKTSAQITKLYDADSLVGRQVVAVVNFPPKQIANMMSECLVLGGIGNDKEIILLQPERQVENGTRIG